MTGPTLGEMLAKNIARQNKTAEDSAAALSLMRTEEARRQFKLVSGFFDKARDYFTTGILGGLPASELFLQLGGRNYSDCLECHEDVAEVVKGWQALDTKKGPDSFYDPKMFASLWHEFQEWARSQGLTATWAYCWDGGGMSSWWQLRVAPVGATRRGS